MLPLTLCATRVMASVTLLALVHVALGLAEMAITSPGFTAKVPVLSAVAAAPFNENVVVGAGVAGRFTKSQTSTESTTQNLRHDPPRPVAGVPRLIARTPRSEVS